MVMVIVSERRQHGTAWRGVAWRDFFFRRRTYAHTHIHTHDHVTHPFRHLLEEPHRHGQPARRRARLPLPLLGPDGLVVPAAGHDGVVVAVHVRLGAARLHRVQRLSSWRGVLGHGVAMRGVVGGRESVDRHLISHMHTELRKRTSSASLARPCFASAPRTAAHV